MALTITRLGTNAITSVSSTAISGTLPAANINDTSISNITALPAGVGGKVLQVLSTTSTSGYVTTSTSFQLATDFAVTITPSSVSNKVYISYSIWGLVGGTNQHIGYSLRRTVGGVDTTLTSTTYGFNTLYSTNGNLSQGACVCTFLDSPNTTSAVTYTPLFVSPDGTSVTFGQVQRLSSTVAMEIAG